MSRAARGILSDGRERRLTGMLAAVELAFAVVLTVSAGLLLSSFWSLTAVDPGFNAQHLIAARVSPPGFAKQTPAARVRLADRLLERLNAVAGVTSAGAADAIPFDAGLHGAAFDLDGDDRAPADSIYTEYHGISPGYLATMGTPILEGRGFTDRDDRDDAPRVALVSRSLAGTLWGDKSPIGARIMFIDGRQYRDAQGSWKRWFTIVGVVDDVHWSSVPADSRRMVYLPIGQFWDIGSLRLVIRSSKALASVAGALGSIVRQLDPEAAVSDIQTFDARLGDSVARPRFTAYLLTAFAVIALFLSAIGVYGVLSYAASRRIPEIGVRLAFGASARDAFGLLFGQGLKLTLIGIAIGIPAALGAGRLLSGLLYGVDALDVPVLAVAAIVLLLVGLAVSYFPARHAARVDPMAALRSE